MQHLPVARLDGRAEPQVAGAQERFFRARHAIEQVADGRERAGFARLVGAVDDVQRRRAVELQFCAGERPIGFERQFDDPHADRSARASARSRASASRCFEIFARQLAFGRHPGFDGRNRLPRLLGEGRIGQDFVEQSGEIQFAVAPRRRFSWRARFDQKFFQLDGLAGMVQRIFDFDAPA